MPVRNKIILSFDVEEFDLPLEYGLAISVQEQLDIGYAGLLAMEKLIETKHLCSTLFTTAFFAENFPTEVRALSVRNEIASHSYFHSSFKDEDLKNSRCKLESVIGKQVYGLRMPRMQKASASVVKEAGYWYDSSINPTWIPGRYNNLKLPRKPYSEHGVVQFPVSVSSRLRLPLFWLAFKNLPYNFYLNLALGTLRRDGYLSFYFHPWEFVDLSRYKLPFYLKKNGKKFSGRFQRLITDLSNEAEFITALDFLDLQKTL
jgi:hypothetical protein